MTIIQFFDVPNGIAFAVFLVSWLVYALVVDNPSLTRKGLSRRMNRQRRAWMETMFARELRMIDTAIMAGLQQGTAFFASSCIFVIGGCFALMGSAEQIAAIASDLPFDDLFQRALVEAKLLGLIAIFAFAFFKFGWAYRLFNYCAILIGAVPMPAVAAEDPEAARMALDRALRMNQIAARHFNSGLRAMFFGLAYLGWFLGPGALVASTVLLVVILLHRQFLSDANEAARDRGDERR